MRVGDKLPASSYQVINSEQQSSTLEFPNSKTKGDKFILVLFFNSSQTPKQIVDLNQQIEQILNRFQNNPCKGASEIEYVTVCADPEFSTWQKLLNEGHLNNTKFKGNKTNYLAKKGVQDELVKSFSISKFPSLFVVNPKGRLWLETDNAKDLEKAFINICRNNPLLSTVDVAGKLLFGDFIKKPLTELSVFLVNQKHDTIRTTKTDNYGDFLFTQVDTSQKLSIKIEQNEKIRSEPKVYLAKQSGEVISEIMKSGKGQFEYRLLSADISKLSPIDEDEDLILKYKSQDIAGTKNIRVYENIYYEIGKYEIALEAELILDKVISILNAHPEIRLEIISHTDSRGDDVSNLHLSQKRSNSVMDYLVSNGINKSRLKPIGKGEEVIINRCQNGIECTEKEHELNRRTEFNFIKN